MNYPLVTIIILNWNQADMTMDCLRSLQCVIYPNFRIVIVDNGSQDQSVEKIHSEFPGITVIENGENVGYSEGNNLGIRYALQTDTKYIFLLNNDTLVDPNMLSLLVDVAESDPQIGITGPTMFYADPPDMLWAGENRIDLKRTRILKKRMGETVQRENLEMLKPIDVDYIDSCAILIRREVFEKIGLLDSKFFINFDDVDLNLRASKGGYKVVYVPRAIIWHRVSAALGIASPANTYYMTRNSFLFYLKHTTGIRKLAIAIRLLFNISRTTIAWFIKPQYHTSLYQKRRKANLLAIRDYAMHQFGKMGPDVNQICYGK